MDADIHQHADEDRGLAMHTEKTQPSIIDDGALEQEQRSSPGPNALDVGDDDITRIERRKRRGIASPGGFQLLKWAVSLGLVLVVWEILARNRRCGTPWPLPARACSCAHVENGPSTWPESRPGC